MAHAEEHADHHPTERSYWAVFVVLAVLTAIEVAWSYLGLSGAALVLPLIAMMVVKFLLVAGWFMHLWPDMKAINGSLFMWTFGGSIALAALVYLVVFAAFDLIA
jgi:caa(3)-type oxidase subunit IV